MADAICCQAAQARPKFGTKEPRFGRELYFSYQLALHPRFFLASPRPRRSIDHLRYIEAREGKQAPVRALETARLFTSALRKEIK